MGTPALPKDTGTVRRAVPGVKVSTPLEGSPQVEALGVRFVGLLLKQLPPSQISFSSRKNHDQ